MQFDGKFEKRTSKAGNQYEVLIITYKGFEKDVYLDKAEKQLLQLYLNDNNDNKEEPEMPFLR